jgi:cupin 2 domain-containing protein
LEQLCACWAELKPRNLEASMLPIANLFAPSPHPADGEEFFTLLENSSVKIERILSHAQASPPDFWYDQDHDEWVALLRGNATLEFAEYQQHLEPGDHLLIPAHTRHRIAHTSADALWLAVHLRSAL